MAIEKPGFLPKSLQDSQHCHRNPVSWWGWREVQLKIFAKMQPRGEKPLEKVMQITLNKQQEQFIAAQLARGNFNHPDEVVNTAFRLLEKLQAEYEEWLTETRAKVEEAALEMDRGEGLDGETFVLEILERFQQAKGGNVE